MYVKSTLPRHFGTVHALGMWHNMEEHALSCFEQNGICRSEKITQATLHASCAFVFRVLQNPRVIRTYDSYFRMKTGQTPIVCSVENDT